MIQHRPGTRHAQPAETARTRPPGSASSSACSDSFVFGLVLRVLAWSLILQRVFILSERGAVVRLWHGEARRKIAIEEARALQLGETGQIANAVEAEMVENASVVP